MSRPRGGDCLEDEISSLKEAGVDVLVSLLDASEISELELEKEPDYCEKLGIDFRHFPITDRSTPASIQAAKNFVDGLQNLLRQEKRIVIHCRQGIGRSSLIAASILVKDGHSADEAFSIIVQA